jgi:integrase
MRIRRVVEATDSVHICEVREAGFWTKGVAAIRLDGFPVLIDWRTTPFGGSTGARREEVAGMKWSELDLDARVWLLPSARTKNSRDHRIPLAHQAVAILDRRAIAVIKEGLGYMDSDLVFSTTGTTSPSGFSKAKRALDARMQEILGPKFKPWRVHDLRRTCATGMEHLGVDLRVIEAALNHVSGTKAGIVGVYQRAEHREAARAAFEAWDARVAELTGQERPSNVVSLSRA